jgi:uncharacterized DUF497 family protein
VRFTWDPAKAVSNLVKHGVTFDDVHLAEMEIAVVRATLNHDSGEPRLLALVPIDDRVHVLVYTVDRGSCHVISLRKANEREIDRYETALQA